MRRLSLVMLCALIALVFSVVLTGHKANRTLPFGTQLTVCYMNRCAYDVPVIDRGPYVYGRDLDVTQAVADQIGLTYAGVGLVTWWVE
jgi:rare lipoprotein A (peptidoglycan hydrolase)